jgi:formamidopyrimidine-DNA glycosylase
MPELPEVETIRRELERESVGRKIKSVQVVGLRSIRRHGRKKQEFIDALVGAKVKSVGRKGKYLLVGLDTGKVLVMHLGMSGQLRKHQPKDPVAKHTHITITFTQGGEIRFIDPRTFGEMFVSSAEELPDVEELAHMGIDPVEEPVSWQTFGRLLMSHKMKLKAFLMDQSIIAGIGNIYSDEILYQAGLRYDRISDSLSLMEIRRLYRAVVETLHEAVKYNGSTLDDASYVDLYGKPGEFAQFHEAYGRWKEPCRRCRTPIAKTKFAGRTSYFCGQCQI